MLLTHFGDGFESIFSSLILAENLESFAAMYSNIEHRCLKATAIELIIPINLNFTLIIVIINNFLTDKRLKTLKIYLIPKVRKAMK